MGFFERATRTMETACESAVDSITDEFIQKVRDNTPEDTGKLEKSNTRTPVKRIGNAYEAIVENKVPYAKFVEKGVLGRSYRYNKPKGNIFRVGVGARMYDISAFQLKGKLKTKIELGIKAK